MLGGIILVFELRSRPVTRWPGFRIPRDLALGSGPGMSFHQRTPRQPEAMMSSAREHYEEAEGLLALARAEQDSIRRSLILAEAQVHATLALSTPAGMGPPGPGRDEAAGTQSTGAAHPDMREGGVLRPARPAGQPDSLSPETPTSSVPVITGSRTPTDNQPVRDEAPLAPAGFVRTGNPSQPVPGTVIGQPGPDDPGIAEPGDLGDQKLRGPEEEKPGGISPAP
jgi:hypothetical protein